jgi:hypothetical protein
MPQERVAAKKVRENPVAFEDRTTPEQRAFGVYLIRSPGGDYSQTFTGSYRMARRLARSRTRYGEIELVFIEAMDTPAAD